MGFQVSLNLLRKLQSQLQLSFFFVAHDLSVIRHFCDRVVVLYLGRVAEVAVTDALFAHPLHPYTSALLRAIDVAYPHVKNLVGFGNVERCKHAVQKAVSGRCL